MEFLISFFLVIWKYSTFSEIPGAPSAPFTSFIILFLLVEPKLKVEMKFERLIFVSFMFYLTHIKKNSPAFHCYS